MSEQTPGPNPYDPAPRPTYGAGGVPWGAPPDHPQSTLVLVLGIIGVAACQVVAPFAWVIGGRVRREIAASGGRVGGHQTATIGWVLGIVGSCLLIASLLLVVLYVIFVIVAIGAGGA